MKSRLVIFIILLLFWNWSCARRPVPMEKPEAISARELVSRLQARSSFWKLHQAKLEIKGESPKGKFRFQSVILAQLPDKFRLEAYTTWGQTAGVLIINKKDSSLYIPSEKVVYSANSAQDLVRFFLGVPIPIEVFGYSLIASVPPDQLDDLQILRDSSGWQATARTLREALQFSWQILAGPPALKTLNVKGERSDYTVSYEPAVSLDPESTPKKINFISSQWHMEVNVSQMQTTHALQPAVFTLPFPEGIRKVNLD